MKKVDVLVIGAGVLGSSVAYALAQRGIRNVLVVDADLKGEMASSTLNVGGVRATWWSHVNIEMSLRSLEYFWTIRDTIAYRRVGYLWLYDAKRWPLALQAIQRQNRYGLNIQALSATDVHRHISMIDRLDGIAGATFSPLDGLVESRRIRDHYRQQAIACGVQFGDRRLVTAIIQDGCAWRVIATPLDDHVRENDVSMYESVRSNEATPILARLVVNAAGPWAARIASMYGDTLPVMPVRRQVFYVKPLRWESQMEGMIVDTSDAFIQPVGEYLLCGYANPDEPAGYNFHWEGEEFYNRWVLPRLVNRSSAFREMQLIGGWSRLYEVSPDHSGIVGTVSGRPGLYQAHSFSGHGVMQSYAAGQALAELMTEGRYVEWQSVEALDPQRFHNGKPVVERLMI